MSTAVTLRAATMVDVDAVTSLVTAAYTPYIERIGSRPGPMQADYRTLVAAGKVVVAEQEGGIVGVVVTTITGADIVIENVAVRPDRQGTGIGRVLLDHAEGCAVTGGYRTVLLYTHELMTENIAIYAQRGYREYSREPMPDGGTLVHMRKRLS